MSARKDAYVRRAKALRVIAERRLGEILVAMPKATGTRGVIQSDMAGAGGTNSEPPADAPTLADIGIDKTRSRHRGYMAAT